MQKTVLTYTMFHGLGDFIVMGDLAIKAPRILENVEIVLIHRNNPFVSIIMGTPNTNIFNIYSIEFSKLTLFLRGKVKKGYRIFGIQQAPGSLQGFCLLRLLKKLGLLHYVVDFNLINADIITPPRGKYILHRHLHQLEDILSTKIPESLFHLSLPFNIDEDSLDFAKEHLGKGIYVGIHPSSGRENCGTYIWDEENWRLLLKEIASIYPVNGFVLIGSAKSTRSLYESLSKQIKGIPIIPLFNLDIIKTSAVIKNLKLFISLNSGPVHIAYALKIPTIVLSGPTLEIWNPVDKNIYIVRDKSALFPPSEQCKPGEGIPNVENIKLEEVLRGVSNLMDKSL